MGGVGKELSDKRVGASLILPLQGYHSTLIFSGSLFGAE